MHHLIRVIIRVTGFIIALILLLAIVVGPAQAHQARTEQSHAVLVSTDDSEHAEDTALTCLALVGSAVLLAGVVWMRKLRRMLS